MYLQIDKFKRNPEIQSEILKSSGFLKPCMLKHAMAELFRSAFQSLNPIGQFIIHNYTRICAVALTTPQINPNPTLINPNPGNSVLQATESWAGPGDEASFPIPYPEASKWLFKASPKAVLPAVPVPVLQQMENTNTSDIG